MRGRICGDGAYFRRHESFSGRRGILCGIFEPLSGVHRADPADEQLHALYDRQREGDAVLNLFRYRRRPQYGTRLRVHRRVFHGDQRCGGGNRAGIFCDGGCRSVCFQPQKESAAFYETGMPLQGSRRCGHKRMFGDGYRACHREHHDDV